ncbi:MAG: PIN domain-containing protein [Clostridia bacterium]|nr:PIN domain-containing protein [Clostridia bacterium]
MRVLLDTCVIIDTLQNRSPFSSDSNTVFLYAANELFNGFITAKSVTDIYYLVHKSTHDIEKTKTIINKLFSLFDCLDTAGIDCKKAILSETSDYEDAVMIETALRNEIDCIITRNERDYGKSPIKIYTPKQFIELLSKDL